VAFDWQMAQEEYLQANMSTDNPSLAAAIARLERQYEEDKQSALEKQRMAFQQQLRSFMSPSTPFAPYSAAAAAAAFDPFRAANGLTNGGLKTPTVTSKLEKWGKER
jgi:hypothetical protein